MKKLKLNPVLLGFFLMTIFSLAILSSCQKEEVKEELSTELIENTLPFSKQFTVSDLNGENQVVVHVSSGDRSVIDNYSQRSFELIPLYEKPFDLENEEETPLEVADEIEQESSQEVRIQIVEQSLSPGVLGFELVCENVQGYNRSILSKSHYTRKDCITVTPRHGVVLQEVKYYKKRSRARRWQLRRTYDYTSQTTAYCYGGYMVQAKVTMNRTNEWYNYYSVRYWEQ